MESFSKLSHNTAFSGQMPVAVEVAEEELIELELIELLNDERELLDICSERDDAAITDIELDIALVFELITELVFELEDKLDEDVSVATDVELCVDVMEEVAKDEFSEAELIVFSSFFPLAPHPVNAIPPTRNTIRTNFTIQTSQQYLSKNEH